MSTSNELIGRCCLPGDCVWPECTCPGVVRATSTPEGVTHGGRALHHTPSGPQLKRKARPRGWSPLSDWVLVRTKTRSENYASNECRQQDMETWLPRYYEPGKGVPTALFPGYLFVRPGNKWRSLRNTYGVIDIVMMGDRPDYVPRKVLKDLRSRADGDGIVTLPTQRKPKKGERVQIKVGAWQECFGLYDGLSPDKRIQVLVDFMGRTVRLEFARDTSIVVAEV